MSEEYIFSNVNNEIKKLINEKRFAEAERILKVILYVNKNSVVLNLLGLLSYKKCNFIESQEFFIESYKLDRNYEAQYYLNLLFEDENNFKDYYSSLKLCEEQKFKEAEGILLKVQKGISCTTLNIILTTIRFMKEGTFKRRKILKQMKNQVKDDKRAEGLYKLMCINVKSRIRRLCLYILFIVILLILASIILV